MSPAGGSIILTLSVIISFRGKPPFVKALTWCPHIFLAIFFVISRPGKLKIFVHENYSRFRSSRGTKAISLFYESEGIISALYCFTSWERQPAGLKFRFYYGHFYGSGNYKCIAGAVKENVK